MSVGPGPRKRGAKVPARTRQLPLTAADKSASSGTAPAGFHSSLQFATPAIVGKLLHLGIVRLSDLVLHLPLRYEDETRITPIHETLSGDTVQIEGTVIKTEVKFRPGRQLVSEVNDGSGLVTLRYFNFYESQRKALAEGVRVRVMGEIRQGFFGAEMVHPRFKVLRSEAPPLPQALTPIYPTTAGLGQETLRKLAARALEQADLADTLPEPVLRKLKLPAFAEAVRALHNPAPDADAEALVGHTDPAWRRIKFDELLAQQLSMRLHYERRNRIRAHPLLQHSQLSKALLAALPFKLTRAQSRVLEQISTDLTRPHPMQRLLQGDVGSGKTIVAALAALQAIESGYQTAVMAPTEILAEQHYRKFSAWLR